MLSVEYAGIIKRESGAVDKSEFFAIMAAFPSGVTVVTTLDADGTPRGFTSNAICSVSAVPPLLLICVDKNSNTLPALMHQGRWVVNFLRAGHGELSTHFASKAVDKFEGIAWVTASNGMPWLRDASIAYAACREYARLDAGDHWIFVGEVEAGEPPPAQEEPLVYFRRGYHSLPVPEAG